MCKEICFSLAFHKLIRYVSRHPHDHSFHFRQRLGEPRPAGAKPALATQLLLPVRRRNQRPHVRPRTLIAVQTAKRQLEVLSLTIGRRSAGEVLAGGLRRQRLGQLARAVKLADARSWQTALHEPSVPLPRRPAACADGESDGLLPTNVLHRRRLGRDADSTAV